MTVFFLCAIFLSTLAIFSLIHNEAWFSKKRIWIGTLLGVYMSFSFIRFIIMDAYIDANEYMLFFLLTFLLVQLFYDLMEHMVKIWPIAMMAPLFIVNKVLFFKTSDVLDLLAGLVLMVCALTFKRFFNHLIGYGDLIICGVFILWLGLKTALVLIVSGFVINGFICILLFATRRVNKQKQIPFVPSLMCSLLFYLIGGGI